MHSFFLLSILPEFGPVDCDFQEAVVISH